MYCEAPIMMHYKCANLIDGLKLDGWNALPLEQMSEFKNKSIVTDETEVNLKKAIDVQILSFTEKIILYHTS